MSLNEFIFNSLITDLGLVDYEKLSNKELINLSNAIARAKLEASKEMAKRDITTLDLNLYGEAWT